MTQHRLEGICNVDYTMSSYSKMSSKLLNATSTKFFAQQVIIVACVSINMNLTRRRQMSNNF